VDKKRKSILVWILTWAGLLVAVLYSPVGSPDLYVSTRYSIPYRGGMYGVAKISDVPTLKTNVTNVTGSVGNQTYSAGSRNQNSYSASGGNLDAKLNSGSFSGFTYSSNIQRARDKASSIGGSWAGIGSMASRSSGNNAVAQNTGVISMSTDMSMFENNSMNKQSVDDPLPPLQNGGTDPGDDPTGSPIPVGDGWILLLVFVSVYSIWKKISI
jgi:hypothetical protein